MWEVTLIGKLQDYIHFHLFEKMLSSSYNKQVLVAISSNTDNVCISVAVTNKKTINSVKKLILELIIKICKEEYFVDNLRIETEDEDLRYFILLTAVISNLEDEIDYAKVKVKFSKVIHIRSLLRFRLEKLYFLWEKFAKYFNYTFKYKISDELYLEFLKFLANNSRRDGEVVYLEKEDNYICFKNKNNKILSKVIRTDEVGVIVSLIVMAPPKLIINCYPSLSSKIAGLIEYLFEDKVSILL